mgnify:FL=1
MLRLEYETKLGLTRARDQLNPVFGHPSHQKNPNGLEPVFSRHRLKICHTNVRKQDYMKEEVITSELQQG